MSKDQGLDYKINEHFCMSVHYLNLDHKLRGTMPKYPFNVFKQNDCEEGAYLGRNVLGSLIFICEDKKDFEYVTFDKNHRFKIPEKLSSGLKEGPYTLFGCMDHYELRRGHVSVMELQLDTEDFLNDLEKIQKRK